MLGSPHDAEDVVQETLLRAWRAIGRFEPRATLQTWLYRIATNACLDELERRPRRPELLQPFPDAAVEEAASPTYDPAARYAIREGMELALLRAIQELPGRQRAVLILRDVLGWTAPEVAELLDSTVAATNSALQRARATMKEHLPEQRPAWAPGTDATAAERELLEVYVRHTEVPDLSALKQLLSEDVRFSMPPAPGVWEGRDRVVGSWVEGGFGTGMFGSMRCAVTSANRQPAVACYVRRPGDDLYTPLAIDVLRIADGEIAEIVTFGSDVFESFGLPETL
jgi:RNA polymerase sigma-70 factor (ECF subfamily)